MKKLVLISVIFALVIGMAALELVYTTKVYGELYDGLIKVQESIDKHEDVYNDETLGLTHDAVGVWEKNKEILFCLGNHTVLRLVDEKLQSLKAMVNINYTDDAKVTLQVALSLIEAVRNDSVPNLTNLL